MKESPRVNTTISHYRILSRIGAGGKELFYISEDGRLMSAEVKVGGAFESGVPQQLFQASIRTMGFGYCYDVAADGQSFLVNTPAEANNSTPMTVVLNWTSDLKRQQ